MAITALYRKSSNEVIKISKKGQTFSDRDTILWGVLTDPSLTNGSDVKPFRVLGNAKIADPSGNSVKNATQSQIDGFTAMQVDDENKEDAVAAANLLETHPRFRKVLLAFADIIRVEINTLRAQHSLAPRSLAQLKTAMKNRISKDD